MVEKERNNTSLYCRLNPPSLRRSWEETPLQARCGSSFHLRGVCKVPPYPENEWGTPRPPTFLPFPSLRGRQRKVPVCPRSLKPGKGWCIPEGQNSLNSTGQTYRHTDTHRHEKVNDRPLSISPQLQSHAETRELQGTAWLPSLEMQWMLPGSNQSPQRAQR